MKHNELFLIVLILSFSSCLAHKKIYYAYDINVNNSLLNGIKEVKKFYPKNPNEIYALVSFTPLEGRTDIVLNNYSNMTNEIKYLIGKTNRFLFIDSLKIPVLFHIDNQSIVIKKSNIAHLPHI